MHCTRTVLTLLLTAALLAPLGGCQKEVQTKPDYDRPLPPGATALRRLLSPGDWPNLQTPYQGRDGELTAALERSAGWFEAPSSVQHFPVGDVSHLRAMVSVFAFSTILAESPEGLAVSHDRDGQERVPARGCRGRTDEARGPLRRCAA